MNWSAGYLMLVGAQWKSRFIGDTGWLVSGLMILRHAFYLAVPKMHEEYPLDMEDAGVVTKNEKD
ncbi:MAG: hypothetical protein V3W19_15610 [Desulfatiglandales bacterium]